MQGKARGVVKVTDSDAANHPPIVPGLSDGAYHVYDYQFFFRNLRQSAVFRTEQFVNSKIELPDAA